MNETYGLVWIILSENSDHQCQRLVAIPEPVDQRLDGRHRRVAGLDLGLGRHALHDRGQHVLVRQLKEEARE